MRALVILCLVCYAPAALACATCYGDPDAPQTHAMNMAILFMLGVIVTLLSLFAAFFVHLKLRASHMANENRDARGAGQLLGVNAYE